MIHSGDTASRLSPNELDQHLASYVGFDGGDPHAKVWICGIEFGGRAEALQLPLKPARKPPTWSGMSMRDDGCYRRWGYHQRAAKLALAIRELRARPDRAPDIRGWRDVLRSELYEARSGTFKLNLFPLNSRKVADRDWEMVHGSHPLIGTKAEYLTRCRDVRFRLLREEVRMKYQPRVILGTGLLFADDFADAMGLEHPKEGKRIVAQGASRTCMGSRSDPRCSLLVVPFLGGPSGLNSDALIIETARRVVVLLEERS